MALVGTGGLGLWAIQIVKALYSPGVEVVAIDISVCIYTLSSSPGGSNKCNFIANEL